MTSANNWKKLYEKLGCLFYAVASCDRDIAANEIDMLKSCVREFWLKVDETVDEFDTDAAYQIEVVFDWLQAEHYKSEKALKSFENFITENKQLLTPNIKELINKTCKKIAGSFYGVNQEEKQILDAIKKMI